MVVDLETKREAYKFRHQHGLGSKDPINTRSLLLKLKTLAVYKPLQSEKISGIAVKTDHIKSMLINSGRSIGHQNFTIIHELYHLFIQDDFSYMICNPKYSRSEKKIERSANRFASQVLLPEEGIIEMIPENEQRKNKISLGSLYEIEQYFMCSRSALLFRLQGLNLLDQYHAEQYRKDIIRNARLFGYNINLYLSDNKKEVIGDYGKLAKSLFDQERISESHYASLMKDIDINVDEELSGHD
jgi:Zn-dependent peptidase ImmA (M78 family)